MNKKDYIQEIPKHKKKSENKSKSNKRSNHKHDYERVILQQWGDNYSWGKRCKICGRVIDEWKRTEDLIKSKYYISEFKSTIEIFYSPSELKKKFPNLPILKQEGWKTYKEV